MDVFEYHDYRKFLNDWLNTAVGVSRTSLARSIGCSPSWVTRFLSGEVQLTPDQAYGVCSLLGLNEYETDYFLLLVEFERASTQALKNRLKVKMKNLVESNRNFNGSIKQDSKIEDKHRIQYYSSWTYAAVHVACMVDGATPSQLATRLGLSETVVLKLLCQLKTMGLVLNSSGKWTATSKNVHLPADHSMSHVGHANWRNRTIEHLQGRGVDGLHYSAVHCLSKKDLESIRKKLKDAVLNCRKTIENSDPQTLSVLCLDWYEI